MSTSSSAIGVLCLVLVLLGIAGAARSLRAAWLPGWQGSPARLVELVVGTSVAVGLCELLGLVGQVRRAPLVAGALLLWLLAAVFRSTRPSPAFVPLQESVPEPAPFTRPLAAAAVLLVAAQWLLSVWQPLRRGVGAFDALHYHLTYAARLAQSGSLPHVPRFDSLGVATWYPLNNELLQGGGMALLGSDLLSLALPFLALVGMLLSLWVLARPYGVGPLAVLAGCLLLAVLGPAYAGAAETDWAACWPVFAALALVAATRRTGQALALPVVAVAALAGGLALGTKLTSLAAAGVVVVVLVAMSRGRRALSLGLVLVGYLATAGYWFVRNAVVVGNPLPTTPIGVGPRQLPHVPTPQVGQDGYTVLHYLTDARVIRHWFVPGLHTFLGPAWPVVLLLVAAGFVVALARLRTDAVVLSLVAVGVASLVLYLVTPTGAGGPEGSPILFTANIRYAMAALLAGLLLLCLAVAGSRAELPLAALVAALLLVTLARHRAWATGWPSRALGLALVLAAVMVVGRQLGLRARTWTAVAASCLAVVAAVPVQQQHVERSYPRGGGLEALFAAVRSHTGVRVGVVGFPLQYPYFGPRLGNEVHYLAQVLPDESVRDYSSCTALMRRVASDRLDWVVVQGFRGKPAPAARSWLQHQPGVRMVVGNADGAAFRIARGAGPGERAGACWPESITRR